MDLVAIWASVKERARNWGYKLERATDVFGGLSFGQRFLIIFVLACISAAIYKVAFAFEIKNTLVGSSGHVHLIASTGPEWVLIMRDADNCPAGKRALYLNPAPAFVQGCALEKDGQITIVFEDGDVLDLPRDKFLELGKQS